MDLQIAQKDARETFVDQNTAMLWVIDEFHNVETAVGAFNEMGLRSASQFADQAAGDDRHNRSGDRVSGVICTAILVLAY